MKKILLATTAAICAGGVASAEVSLSGEGKLGLSYSKAGAGSAEVDAISSANVKFTLSGTSDNEMIGGFGASFSLDADESVSDDKLGNPFVVYVGSADGPLGKFEGGSDLGAADKKSGGLGDPGLNGIGVDNIAEAYYGGSGKKLRYEKAIAGAGIAVSVDLDDAWAIGGEYAISDQLTIGAGYDQNEVMRGETDADGFNEQNTMSFGVIGSMNQFSAGFLYSSRSTTVPAGQAAVADKAAYGVEVGYSIGDFKVTASEAIAGAGIAVSTDESFQSLRRCPCPPPWPWPIPCPWYEESLISGIELSVEAPALTGPDITIPLQQPNFMSNSLLDSSLLSERAGLAQFSADSYDVSIRGAHQYSHFGI